MIQSLSMLVAICVAVFTGCHTTECENTSQCSDGQACIEETCEDVECLNSSDCDIQHFCTDKYTCLGGCEADGDCRAGEICDTDVHQCTGYSCRDTELDCEYGEYCDTTTGECYEDASHCTECPDGSCDGGGACETLGGELCKSDKDCEGHETCEYYAGFGSICSADYCFFECNPDDEEPCPRGYHCLDFYGDGSFTGCYADCGILSELGYR